MWKYIGFIIIQQQVPKYVGSQYLYFSLMTFEIQYTKPLIVTTYNEDVWHKTD